MRPDVFEPIVPPSLPWPRMIVLVTGVMELALAAGLCVQRTRRLSAYLLMAYFILVFPGNVHMAVNVPGDLPQWALYARLPLQLVFILWASLYCRRPRPVDVYDDVRG